MREDFDWVGATVKCSLAECFERLRIQAIRDVEVRQTARPEMTAYGFRVVSAGPKFSVLREGNRLYRSVSFELRTGEIYVCDEDDKKMFSIQTTISNDGDCKLKIDDEELEFWQCRKRAFEKLFFSEEIR